MRSLECFCPLYLRIWLQWCYFASAPWTDLRITFIASVLERVLQAKDAAGTAKMIVDVLCRNLTWLVCAFCSMKWKHCAVWMCEATRVYNWRPSVVWADESLLHGKEILTLRHSTDKVAEGGGGLLCIVNKKYTYFLSFSPCRRRVFPSGPRCLENTGWRTSVRPPLSLPSKYDRDHFGTKRYLCMHTPVLGLKAVWLSLFYGYAELWHRCGRAICTFMKDKDITFISKWGQV